MRGAVEKVWKHHDMLGDFFALHVLLMCFPCVFHVLLMRQLGAVNESS
jgi:hypothetical protein